MNTRAYRAHKSPFETTPDNAPIKRGSGEEKRVREHHKRQEVISHDESKPASYLLLFDLRAERRTGASRNFIPPARAMVFF